MNGFDQMQCCQLLSKFAKGRSSEVLGSLGKVYKLTIFEQVGNTAKECQKNKILHLSSHLRKEIIVLQ